MVLRQKIVILILASLVCMAFMLSSDRIDGSVGEKLFIDSSLRLSRGFFCFLPVYDTIYIESDRYIELDLKAQRAYLIKRSGINDTFKISSGNPNVKKGIITSTGIFTVQSKSPIAISKQFNNAEMYHWIGFNGNIGIHGLKGTGYYSTLGLRPSSHGCVRIAREDGEKLYDSVRKGTPVLVHNGDPGRIFAFSDSNSYYSGLFLTGKYRYEKKLLAERMKNLYKGHAINNSKTKILLDRKTILRGADIESGDYSRVPARQSDFVLDRPNANESKEFTFVCNFIDLKKKAVDITKDTTTLIKTIPVKAKTKSSKKRK